LLPGEQGMIRLTKAAIAASVFAGLALGATSAEAASGTATSRARVLRQVTVSVDRDLNFGTIVGGTSAASVTVDPTGALTGCGVVGSGGVCGGSTTSARFNVSGTAGQVVGVTSSPTTFSISNTGGDTMTVHVDTISTTSQTLSGTFGQAAAGTAAFTFGGTLDLGVSQADGDYSGTFNMSFDYQ
jgi:Mat/Ecp fimbriae major subunit